MRPFRLPIAGVRQVRYPRPQHYRNPGGGGYKKLVFPVRWAERAAAPRPAASVIASHNHTNSAPSPRGAGLSVPAVWRVGDPPTAGSRGEFLPTDKIRNPSPEG